MKVKEWISYKKAKKYKESVSGFGGFFNFQPGKTNEEDQETGMRWKDYLNMAGYNEESYPYLNAIKKSVIENDLKLTGEQHQYSKNGVPLFEDDTVASFSWRAWGDLMAAIWSDEEDKDYCYMDFYM